MIEFILNNNFMILWKSLASLCHRQHIKIMLSNERGPLSLLKLSLFIPRRPIHCLASIIMKWLHTWKMWCPASRTDCNNFKCIQLQTFLKWYQTQSYTCMLCMFLSQKSSSFFVLSLEVNLLGIIFITCRIKYFDYNW